MPIFEFYCPDCHAIFSFMVQGVIQDGDPHCPTCQRPALERRPSRFAIGQAGGSSQDPEPTRSVDEAQLEGAMTSLAQAMVDLGGSEDPRALSRVFRQFGKESGLEVGPGLEKALSRMDRGEDLEAIERDLDASEESLADLFRLRGSQQKKKTAPRIDEALHFLDSH